MMCQWLTKSPEEEIAEKSRNADAEDFDSLTGTVPPLNILSIDLVDTLTSFDLGEIRLPKDMPDTYHPNKCFVVVKCRNFSVKGVPGGTSIKLFLEPTKITPEFVQGEIPMKFLYSNSFSFLDFEFVKGTPEGKFNGMVEIRAQGFSEPIKLPISGTIVYE